MNRDECDSQIAVIGCSGRFPQSKNLDDWWSKLRDGVELVSFFSENELLAEGVEPAHLHSPNYVRAKAILDAPESFAATFFGFSPREAEIIDPQQRIFLECAYEALESAGYSPDRFQGRIGVFAGVSLNTYLLNNLLSNQAAIEPVGGYQVMISSDKDFLGTLVSYKLNLKGPSMTVQTACSTSLVAVHMACQSLLSGECDLVLTGGVSVKVPQKSGYLYQEGSIMSPDGHCRAFDAKAQGTLDGNGAGVVVLKRLSDAVRDGDKILAVIRGSAINNDGSQKVGFTAPSIQGQSEVIAEAQAMAGVTADTISYVEAHGTGTPLGDPIEVAALTQAFRATSEGRQYCALGSVKTNVGHLDAAAGIAGLIKTVLQLEHKELVPSLHYEKPNPKIDFASSPFYVNTKLQEWKANGGPRRAGVSSFGIGGTNAHVVLEEAPEREASGESRPWQVLPVSAKTETALEAAAANLGEHIKRNEGEKLGDVAYTQGVGRSGYKHRRVVVCETREEAQAALEGQANQRVFTGVAEGERGIGFLFPGQGAQYVGMGRGLYEREKVYREEVDRCAEQLRNKLGMDLREVLYPAAGEEERAREQLKQTRVTQPALFVVEWGLAELWRSWGVEPEVMAGHSVGEYVAATVAGVLELEEALEVVAERGRLMQEVERGAMLSVPLEEEEVRGMLGEGLWIGAVNGPGLTVVSGGEERIEELEQALKSRGVEGRRLETSHGFHSGMMDGVLEEFRRVMQGVGLKAPRKRYLSNVTGTWIREEEATDPGYWVKHLRETVRFGENVKELLCQDWILLEVGPGNVLGSMARRQGAREVYGSLRSAQETGTDQERIARTLGRMWVSGVAVDWEGYYRGEKRHRLALPTYPFERQRYSIELGKRKPAADFAEASVTPQKKTDVADWFYMVSWERSQPIYSEQTFTGLEKTESWLVFQSADGYGEGLAEQLRAAHQDVVCVIPGPEYVRLDERTYVVPSANSDSYKLLLRDLRQQGRTPTRIVHLWNVSMFGSSATAPESDDALPFYSLLYLAQSLASEMDGNPIDLTVVTSHLHEVVGDEQLVPERATLLGICNVIPAEYPDIRCRMVDLNLVPADAAQRSESERQILAECFADSDDDVVAHRGAYRWVRRIKPVHWNCEESPSCLRKNGAYVITGGLGGVGLALAEYLAASVQARLVLVGRSEFPERRLWPEWLNERPDSEVSSKIRSIEKCEALGAKVLLLSADLSDPQATTRMIADAEAHFGTLHGVIHAAGVSGGRLIPLLKREQADHVFAPKVAGTRNLFLSLKDKPLDFVVLCSSQRSLLAAPGSADYCSANAFLDAFAQSSRSRWRTRTVSIVWDSWQNTGMAKGLEGAGMDADFSNEVARYGMTVAEGVEVFRRILSSRLPVVVVSTREWQARVEQHRPLSTEKVLELFSKRAQPSAHERPNLSTSYAAPTARAEHILTEIWQELLGIERIGVNDNFFELGGDSVVSLQMISRARQAGLDLSIKQAFQRQTVAELAALVGQDLPIAAERADRAGEASAPNHADFNWTEAQIASITTAIDKAMASD